MLTLKENRKFASILSDGLIHITVPEGTEKAVVRKYKTSDGKEGAKTELQYSEIIGKITNISFFEGDFGKQLQLTIDAGEQEPVVLSLSTSSNFGEDTLKKLPNIDLEKTVKIVPFSFTDDKGKKKKGVTIWQKDDKNEPVKIKNFFYDEEKKCNINGYPEPKEGKKTKSNPDGKLTKDAWKIYFAECREFLVQFVTDKFNIEESKVAGGNDDWF